MFRTSKMKRAPVIRRKIISKIYFLNYLSKIEFLFCEIIHFLNLLKFHGAADELVAAEDDGAPKDVASIRHGQDEAA
jgi:hypothetical protein